MLDNIYCILTPKSSLRLYNTEIFLMSDHEFISQMISQFMPWISIRFHDHEFLCYISWPMNSYEFIWRFVEEYCEIIPEIMCSKVPDVTSNQGYIIQPERFLCYIWQISMFKLHSTSHAGWLSQFQMCGNCPGGERRHATVTGTIALLQMQSCLRLSAIVPANASQEVFSVTVWLRLWRLVFSQHFTKIRPICSPRRSCACTDTLRTTAY